MRQFAHGTTQFGQFLFAPVADDGHNIRPPTNLNHRGTHLRRKQAAIAAATGKAIGDPATVTAHRQQKSIQAGDFVRVDVCWTHVHQLLGVVTEETGSRRIGPYDQALLRVDQQCRVVQLLEKLCDPVIRFADRFDQDHVNSGSAHASCPIVSSLDAEGTLFGNADQRTSQCNRTPRTDTDRGKVTELEYRP